MQTIFVKEISGDPSLITQSFQTPLYFGADIPEYTISYIATPTRTVMYVANDNNVNLFLNFQYDGWDAIFISKNSFSITETDSAASQPVIRQSISVTENDITFYQYRYRFSSNIFQIENAPLINEQTITSSAQEAISAWQVAYIFYNSEIVTDPYELGSISGTGGGTGTFSGTGDNIGIPALPTLSAVSAGFITLFTPSVSQMANLASYMWSGAFDIETYRKIFANPMDCILGLSIVPVSVPSGGLETVKVGNISTGISMTLASSQYVEVDCGTLNVQEYWGAYLDYDPYTKAELYLPYIGTHPIAVDDIMGKSVHVVYHVDILSGACIAYVQCGGTVLYSFIGQCSSSIPITGNDWTNVVNGVLTIAGSIGSMVATGGASAPAAVGSIVSTATNSLKTTVEKSGSLSGTGGMMGVQTPYLILTRPRQALPEKQNAYLGYPSFIHENLSDLKGYTEIEEIHLENVPATGDELSEIENLLKGGVIL